METATLSGGQPGHGSGGNPPEVGALGSWGAGGSMALQRQGSWCPATLQRRGSWGPGVPVCTAVKIVAQLPVFSHRRDHSFVGMDWLEENGFSFKTQM